MVTVVNPTASCRLPFYVVSMTEIQPYKVYDSLQFLEYEDKQRDLRNIPRSQVNENALQFCPLSLDASL